MRATMPNLNRLIALAAILVLALGAVACGDSDDGGDDGADRATAPSTTQTSADEPPAGAPNGEESGKEKGESGGDGSADPSSDDGGSDAPSGDGESEEERVEAVVEEMYSDFAAADAAGVCAALTERAREQIAQNPIEGSTEPRRDRTCAKSFAQLLEAAASSGTLDQVRNISVQSVRVQGDVARAEVALNGRSGDIRLVKEDGEWRFGEVPSGR